MNKEPEFILDFLKALRHDEPYVQAIFMNGGCYRFHLFLKKLYPDSECYIQEDDDHVVTKIGDHLYDVRGMIEEKFVDMYRPLPTELLEEVESWSFHRRSIMVFGECQNCEEPIYNDFYLNNMPA